MLVLVIGSESEGRAGQAQIVTVILVTFSLVQLSFVIF